jgi:DNA-binding SARP family transcriptional activator/TolB-like protein
VPNEPSKLRIATLGQLGIRCNDRVLAVAGRRARALIGYLVLSEADAETRERLVGLLWSETEEEKARASLRQALHELRRALDDAGFDGLLADKLAIRIDRSRVGVDMWDILEEAHAGRAHALLLHVERPLERLLEDLETVDPAFRIWLLAKRQTLADRVRMLLEKAIRNSDAPEAEREVLARALMNLDPTHEEAARVRIRARAESGDIGVALGIYKALWDLLDAEYDVEPSKETQELIAAIKLGQPPTGHTAATAPAATVPERQQVVESIPLPAPRAVELPRQSVWPKLIVSIAEFREAEPKQESHYLLQGFRREMIACLVRFREWVVRDATIAPTKGDPSPGRNGAEYLIEASALRAGDSALRVVITLRDLMTNAYLWSERLTISVANWFEVQQHVVRRITTALNVHLSAERMVSIAHRPPGDLKAYDLWLLGQATVLTFDPQNWEAARTLFRQVIAHMPDFAPAYSSLAQLDNVQHIVIPGVFRDSRRTEQALTYAREAARLDPIDSRSQLCLGWSHAMAKQYEQAMIFMGLAYELNENDPWTLVSSATCLSFCGQYERASEIAEHTLHLPLAPNPLQWAYHTTIRFMGGDYEGVVQAAAAAGDVNLSVPGYKASALFHLGDRAGAAAEFKRYMKLIRTRWVGKEPASDANITRWFLTMFPIRRPDDWQRLRDGLAGAGAPVQGLAHHQW